MLWYVYFVDYDGSHLEGFATEALALEYVLALIERHPGGVGDNGFEWPRVIKGKELTLVARQRVTEYGFTE